MFFHKSRLTLSPEAQKDFTGILRYTEIINAHAALYFC